jgi:hypothetical protein
VLSTLQFAKIKIAEFALKLRRLFYNIKKCSSNNKKNINFWLTRTLLADLFKIFNRTEPAPYFPKLHKSVNLLEDNVTWLAYDRRTFVLLVIIPN